MEVEVKNMKGEKVKTVDLPAEIFEAPIRKDLMHQALLRQLANARLGTHDTRGRGEVARSDVRHGVREVVAVIKCHGIFLIQVFQSDLVIEVQCIPVAQSDDIDLPFSFQWSHRADCRSDRSLSRCLGWRVVSGVGGPVAVGRFIPDKALASGGGRRSCSVVVTPVPRTSGVGVDPPKVTM